MTGPSPHVRSAALVMMLAVTGCVDVSKEGKPTASSVSTVASAASHFDFAVPPKVLFTTFNDNVLFAVYMRINKSLPRTQRGPSVTVSINGASGDALLCLRCRNPRIATGRAFSLGRTVRSPRRSPRRKTGNA